MKFLKTKIYLILLIVVFLFFFANDFGLIDIENTAIITAIAIDKSDDDYKITAEVAVPEPEQTTTTKKSQINGKGKTMAGAIKNLSNVSGWYPNLYFCNLLIVGGGLIDENLIDCLDYFSKSLRVQDSALIVFAEEKAEDLLKITTPLDEISSFALQKVLLKTNGFDLDVMENNIKNFCSDYYYEESSSYIPVVKPVYEQKDGQSSGADGGSSNGGSGGEKLSYYDVTNTALIKNGKKVAELTKNETFAFNMIFKNLKGCTMEVNDVTLQEETQDFLIKFTSSNGNVNVSVSDKIDVTVSFFGTVKILDQNGTEMVFSDSSITPIPEKIMDDTKSVILEYINGLIEKTVSYKCDILKIKEKLYRYNYKQYSLFKDNFYDNLNFNVTVDLTSKY